MTILPLLLAACTLHQPTTPPLAPLPALEPPAALVEPLDGLEGYEGCPDVALVPESPETAPGLPQVGTWAILAGPHGLEAWGAPCDGVALPTDQLLDLERQASLADYWEATARAERRYRELDRALTLERHTELTAAHIDLARRERVLRWTLGLALPVAVTGAAVGGVYLGARAVEGWE